MGHIQKFHNIEEERKNLTFSVTEKIKSCKCCCTRIYIHLPKESHNWKCSKVCLLSLRDRLNGNIVKNYKIKLFYLVTVSKGTFWYHSFFNLMCALFSGSKNLLTFKPKYTFLDPSRATDELKKLIIVIIINI